MSSSKPGVLVTGGLGFIGSVLVHRLVEEGHRVVIVDNLVSGFEWRLPKDRPIVFVNGDFGDQKLVQLLINEYRIDSVFHLAASIAIEDSRVDPLGYYENNLIRTKRLLNAISGNYETVKHFIFASSCAVYGTPSKTVVAEKDPTQCENPYGRSKLACEWIIEDYARSRKNFNFLNFRFFNVAGAWPEMGLGFFGNKTVPLFEAIISALRSSTPELPVFGLDHPTSDGSCTRDYIHVRDLVEALIAGWAALKTGGNSGALNVGYGRALSVLEVVREFEAQTENTINVIDRSRRPGEISAIFSDTHKLKSSIKWRPQFNSLQGLVSDCLVWDEIRNPRR